MLPRRLSRSLSIRLPRGLSRRLYAIAAMLILLLVACLFVIPLRYSTRGNQSERKVTGSGVDSFLFEYDSQESALAGQDGIFRPFTGGTNAERATGSKIARIEILDENENVVQNVDCRNATCSGTFNLNPGNRFITVADSTNGVVITYDKTGFKRGRNRKWRLNCGLQLRSVMVTSSSSAQPIRQNCANGKCTMDITYTF